MQQRFLTAIFRDEDNGYVAMAAAAPGVSGTGNTPDQAASDLLAQFLSPFDDLPHPPTPDAELVAIQEAEVSVSSFHTN